MSELIIHTALILSIALIITLAYGSFNIRSNMFIRTKSKSRTFPKGILITFDDGPDEFNTPLILDILNKRKVRALFFVTGKKIMKNPEIIKRMNSEGHVLGNHTYSHSNFFPFYSSTNIVAELEKTRSLIAETTGVETKFFRPPFGVTNTGIASVLRKSGYITVGWSVRSLDTVLRKREKILSSVIKKVKGGDIVLFHDTVPGTVKMLEEFIAECQNNGFEFPDPERFLLEE